MRDGLVYMHAQEERRIAAHLGLTVAVFRKKFDATWQEESECWAIEAKDGRGCPLLTSDRRCSVHPVKPSQCGSWPFWPEMLDDRRVWDEAKSFCKGLDAPEGRRYTPAEIQAIRDEDERTREPDPTR